MGKIKISVFLFLLISGLMAGKAYAAASFLGFDRNPNAYYTNNGRGNYGYYRSVDANDVNRGQCHHKHSDSQWDANRDGHVDRSEWQRREARYDGNYYAPQTYANYPSNYNAAYNPSYNNYGNNGYYPTYNNPGYAYNPGYGYNPAYNQQTALQARDLNGDGYISPQEWNGNLNTFNLLDSNRNGYLSNGELKTRLATNILGGLLNTFLVR